MGGVSQGKRERKGPEQAPQQREEQTHGSKGSREGGEEAYPRELGRHGELIEAVVKAVGDGTMQLSERRTDLSAAGTARWRALHVRRARRVCTEEPGNEDACSAAKGERGRRRGGALLVVFRKAVEGEGHGLVTAVTQGGQTVGVR
jgi:hypothetical protein